MANTKIYTVVKDGAELKELKTLAFGILSSLITTLSTMTPFFSMDSVSLDLMASSTMSLSPPTISKAVNCPDINMIHSKDSGR